MPIKEVSEQISKTDMNWEGSPVGYLKLIHQNELQQIIKKIVANGSIMMLHHCRPHHLPPIQKALGQMCSKKLHGLSRPMMCPLDST